ncbi:hypothetical protein [Croceibacterium mercuriale]|uniref:hypothetical protein n=1 Tax=Croceibacterium mercuriale TaxID=1572751 RepID=UPI001269AB38|nr:hypothetical protein [Croceibacterium mercuriale]
MQDLGTPLSEGPDESEYYAVAEMHYGRLEWLAEHIRRSEMQIGRIASEKLLALIEGSDPDCLFKLVAVRNPALPPAKTDARLRAMRDFDLAIEVARRGGFRRGQLMHACHEVGQATTPKISSDTLAKRVRPFRDTAKQAVAEEAAAEAYRNGQTDYLGRPIFPEKHFAGVSDDP